MFQKADTVKFYFHQVRRYSLLHSVNPNNPLQKLADHSGEVKDQDGKTVYRMHDEGEDHKLTGYFKSYVCRSLQTLPKSSHDVLASTP